MLQYLKKREDLRNIDWVLLVIVGLLCICGLFMVANATGDPPLDQDMSLSERLSQMDWGYVRRNALWILIGLVAGAAACVFDYSFYTRLWPWIYAFAAGLLVLVKLMAVTKYGADSWFAIGERGFQPSEIAKLALILALAALLSKGRSARDFLTVRQLAVALFWVMVPLVLIILQPDYGTALVYVAVTAVMLFTAGIRLWHLGVLVGGSVLAVIPLWQFVLSDTRKNRILVFLDPSLDPTGSGLNVLRAKQAVGSGQLLGKGMFDPDSMTQLGYIPVQYSDFIFASTAETWGYVGAVALIVLYAALVLRLIWLARQAADYQGSLIVMGVAAMFMFHIMENIGMCLGVMPCTGIPLPFTSYGGSAMVTNMIAIGLVINVAMKPRRVRAGTLPVIS